MPDTWQEFTNKQINGLSLLSPSEVRDESEPLQLMATFPVFNELAFVRPAPQEGDGRGEDQKDLVPMIPPSSMDLPGHPGHCLRGDPAVWLVSYKPRVLLTDSQEAATSNPSLMVVLQSLS